MTTRYSATIASPPPCDMCNYRCATDSVDGTSAREQCAPGVSRWMLTELPRRLLVGAAPWSAHHMRLRLAVERLLETAEVGREIEEDGMDEWFRLASATSRFCASPRE